MKHNSTQALASVAKILTLAFLSTLLVTFNGCKKDDPKPEDVPELITKATLTFTPNGGGTAVVITATDPDGEGVQNITVDGPINLATNKTYVLTLDMINGLAKPTDAAYKVTDEVEEEGDQHQFFFAWTNNTFSNPAGNGNVDNRSDAINYSGGSNSKDKNNRPLGLTTTWTSSTLVGTATLSGTFRVLLKHQPGLKSDTSDSNAGETDLDLTFTLNVN
jgi:hypothetical protein